MSRSAWGLYRESRQPGAPGLLRRLFATPRMTFAVLRGRYPGLSRSKLAGLTLLVALYAVSPLDAIPDFIPVIGVMDDTAVLLWFLTGLFRTSGRFVEWERGSERLDPAPLSPPSGVSGRSGKDLLPPKY